MSKLKARTRKAINIHYVDPEHDQKIFWTLTTTYFFIAGSLLLLAYSLAGGI